MQHYTSSCSGLWLQQLSGNTRTMNLFNFSLKKPTRHQGNQTWNIILANSGWNKWLPDILFKMYNFDFFPLILASQVSSTLYFNSVLTTTYYLSYFTVAFDLLKDGNTFSGLCHMQSAEDSSAQWTASHPKEVLSLSMESREKHLRDLQRPQEEKLSA